MTAARFNVLTSPKKEPAFGNRLRFLLHGHANLFLDLYTFSHYPHPRNPPMYSVLYVDDEPALLEIGKIFLERSGRFRVTTMTSAEEALASPSLAAFDAVISDYQMPGMDGIAFLKEVREKYGDIPFIIFTGKGREDVVIEAINGGAEFYVQKGGDPTAQFADLAHKVGTAIDRRRTQEELRAACDKLSSSQEELRKNYNELVKNEEALRESEEKFRLFIDNAPAALAMFDRDMRYLAASRRWITDFHLEGQELLGRSHYEVFPEITESLKEAHRRSLAGEVISASEDRFERQDGTVQWHSWEVRPWFTASREIGGIIIFSEDTTDRVRAKKALEESRERYHLMLMNAKDGIMINEFTRKGPGKFIEVNDTACRIIGLTRDELYDRSLADLDAEETRQRAPGFVADLEKNRHAVFQIPYRTPAGVEKNLDISVSIFEIDGRPTMFSIVRDITGQVATEQALRESEEKFRALVETSPDMIWEIDPEGRIRYVSPPIQTIMGYSPGELTGRPITDLVCEEGKALAIRELTKRIASARSPEPFEIPGRHRDGHNIVVEIWSSRMDDRDGNMTGFRGVARDITNQRKAEDALQRANRQLTLLGSATRHDALNKITGILGYLKIVSMKCSDPEAKDLLKKAELSVVSLRSLVEFTRIYQDLGSHEPLWTELDAVMPRSQVPKTVTFTSDVAGIKIYADAMLEKVFANLLDNSVRHGEHVTRIRISPSKEGTARVVVWEDDGVGIAAPDKEKIFRRGYGKNTGLGLFLVREILMLTGISIRETGIPGSGARFEIVVPEGKYRLTGRPDTDAGQQA